MISEGCCCCSGGSVVVAVVLAFHCCVLFFCILESHFSSLVRDENGIWGANDAKNLYMDIEILVKLF